MKKTISLLLAVLMMATALSGCGKGADKLVGTWDADSIEADGIKYTVSDIEAIGETELSGLLRSMQLVLKEGGAAYLSIGSDAGVIDWEKTDEGVRIGEEDCTIVDGMICLAYDDQKIYLTKSSDSQTVGPVQGAEDAQIEDTENGPMEG